tara:strand:- start:2443 stop:4425 length:1983 start_codon:yes stop_codon:yes gene_type:complete
MIIQTKPLSGVSAQTLINSSFSLNNANRYFKFAEEDSYLRMYGRHTDHLSSNAPAQGKDNHDFYMRYDSMGLLRKVLKSSIDVDFQNLLNSYLVSQVAYTARRYQGHEFGNGRQGLREGLVINEADNYYDSGPVNVSFETFVDNFIGYYNTSENQYMLGTFANYEASDIDIHRPPFSFGAYKGADSKKSKGKAYQAIANCYARFNEFFDSLLPTTTTRQPHRSNDTKFKVRLLALSGTSNSTSYRTGGSTQAIQQYRPIRDKDGLYAIISVPRDRNLAEARHERGALGRDTTSWSFDPVYSNLFNAYADAPKLGDAFLELSSCVVIRLNDFFNKGAYRYASDYPSVLSQIGDSGGWGGGAFHSTTAQTRFYDYGGASIPDYQTFGPISHLIMPESVYSDAEKASSGSRYGCLPIDHFTSDGKQEFLNLESRDVPEGWPECHSRFTHPSAYTAKARAPHWSRPTSSNDEELQAQTDLAYVIPGSSLISESCRNFYCWVTNSEIRNYKEFASNFGDSWVKKAHEIMLDPRTAAVKAHHEGDYFFGSGSLHGEPVLDRSMLGLIHSKHNKQTKNKDLFCFYSPYSLNSEKLHLKNSQSLLESFKISRDASKRGKGFIYVDQDNIAHCPLSGEALKVRTYLRKSPVNSARPGYRETIPAGVLVS